MSGAQKHERVVDALVRDIFLGNLKPDTKLPTEKQLSEEMKVDRTSLRLGLKQLESMSVLSIRQGDGIYVKDFLKSAGLDFLGFTFKRLEQGGGEFAMDAYLLDEIWEFWILFWPPVLEVATRRASTRDIKSLADLIAQQEACIGPGDRKGMAERLIALQDMTAEIVNNSIVLLFFNSCRPLRRKIIEMLFESMDEAELRGVVEIQKHVLREVIRGGEAEIAEALNALCEKYGAYRRRMREWMTRSLNVKHPDDAGKKGEPSVAR